MTFNKDIMYALITSVVGAVITIYSYSVISLIADPYLLPYVYNNPMNEAVSFIDSFLDRMNLIDGIVALIGVLFLAVAVYFASRYVSRTSSKPRRMIGIIFATFTSIYGVCVVLANFL